MLKFHLKNDFNFSVNSINKNKKPKIINVIVISHGNVNENRFLLLTKSIYAYQHR